MRSPQELVTAIASGERKALSQAITIIESSLDSDMARSEELLQDLAPNTGGAVRIGITGVPGVGKSTFIDALGTSLTREGHKVAVLAVDPSSSISGGSILGDKTRMERLSQDPDAFIRPTPGGDAVGGVARHTREAMLLCEAAGFDVLLVETIGVGQSELAVASMVDTFVLLLLAGAGDELQGIKRGVMELADIFVINKADGPNTEPALQAARQYTAALQLIPQRNPAWAPTVTICSSVHGDGIEDVYKQVLEHREALGSAGIAENRQDQALHWFDHTLREMVVSSFLARSEVCAALPGLREQVQSGALQPTAAVSRLLAI